VNINFNQKKTRIAGTVLIILGVVAIFHLWWAILPALLAIGGVAIYRRQRDLGRTNEAVQGALWGVGLGLLLMIHFLFPGVLLLGGASLLLRGRELEADQRVQGVLATIISRRTPAPAPIQPVAQTRVTVVNVEQPSTGETVRLR